MRPSISISSRPGVLAVFGLALAAIPASAQKAAYVEDFEIMREKFNALAGAMGPETYAWQPMEGVRTVSEVFMLIAAEAYYMPSFWGGDPPAGIEVRDEMFEELPRDVTEKAEVTGHLAAAFAHGSAALAALPEDRRAVVIPFFGQERAISEAIYILLADMHEHLGQAIAYARTNHVVPPWSAGG